MLNKLFCLLLLSSISFRSFGQTQLVLLNREKILLRFTEGDDISFKKKSSKDYTHTFITEIKPFAIITYNDTVPFSSIESVSLKGNTIPKFSLLSKFLITAGVLYFAIDQVNNIIVQGNKPDLPKSVWVPSVALVGTGLVLKLFRKRTQPLRYPARLMAVDRGSPFFQADNP
jgi:hypothetical protein